MAPDGCSLPTLACARHGSHWLLFAGNSLATKRKLPLLQAGQSGTLHARQKRRRVPSLRRSAARTQGTSKAYALAHWLARHSCASGYQPRPSCVLPSLGSPWGRRWEECRQGVERMLCLTRARCARLHGWAYPSRASHAALLQRRQPKGSSLQCHCTARVPSTDAASSRPGVVGSAQSITKAFVMQACICLDHCVARSHLHAQPQCNGMIAPFILDCNPDARYAGRATSRLQTCIRLYHPHRVCGLRSTHRPSAVCLHHCETRMTAEMVLLRHLSAPCPGGALLVGGDAHCQQPKS